MNERMKWVVHMQPVLNEKWRIDYGKHEDMKKSIHDDQLGYSKPPLRHNGTRNHHCVICGFTVYQ
jgi:hypothetical protein